MRKYWQNITDEELNDLFRDAIAQYQPACDRADIQRGWQLIREQLEKKKRPAVPVLVTLRKSGIWFLCFLLLAGSCIWWAIESKTNIESPGGLNQAVSDARVSQPGSQVIRHEGLSRDRVIDSSNFQIETNTFQAVPGKEKLPAVTIPLRYYNNREKYEYNYFDIDSMKNRVDGKNIITSPLLSDAPTPLASMSGELWPSATLSEKIQQLNKVLPVFSDWAFGIASPAINDSIDKKRANKKVGRSSDSRWSIGLNTATEWSNAGGGVSQKPGLITGFMLQYRFLPRISVESGILLGNKLYDGGPDDYTPGGVVYNSFLSVSADCRVVDVPVNIRYDIVQNDKHRIFGGAGLSSFFMQRESYTFKKINNGNIQEDKRDFVNQNQHFFSVLNLGAGYEHQWKNFSLQISPYIKLPLMGIGEGEAGLSSAGVSLSARYRLKTK